MKSLRNEYIYKLTRFTSMVVLSPFFKIKIEGKENLPVKSAFILLPKHQRWVDVPIIAIANPRLLYFVAKQELFKYPVIRWFIAAVGGLSLNRRKPIESRRTLKSLILHLKNGEGIVVFPEGTYHIDKMGPGNLGIVRFVISHHNILFIPMGIKYIKHRSRTEVKVKIGKEIENSQTPEELLTKIMDEIAILSGL